MVATKQQQMPQRQRHSPSPLRKTVEIDPARGHPGQNGQTRQTSEIGQSSFTTGGCRTVDSNPAASPTDNGTDSDHEGLEPMRSQTWESILKAPLWQGEPHTFLVLETEGRSADNDLPSKTPDSNIVWAESQAARKCSNQVRRRTVETTHLSDPQPRRREIVWKKAGPRVWRQLETFS